MRRRTGKPVAIILRPGKTPDGAEVTLVLRHVIGHIRARWPAVDIVVRGDSHYARPEAMAWCERQRVGYIFGLAGNAVLLRRVGDLAEDAALGRLDGEADKVRRYGDFRYAATSWKVERRVIARVEAGPQGADSRFIVTNLAGLPKALYEKVYCARGQAENLIKAHKLHLASDRTSCTKATANQFRLLIHTAAYWLMLSLRGLAPRNIVLARRPVRYDPPLPDQGGRPRHRDGHPDQNRPADRLSLPDRLRHARRSYRQAAAVNDGAVCPATNPSAQPQTPITSVPTPRKNAPRRRPRPKSWAPSRMIQARDLPAVPHRGSRRYVRQWLRAASLAWSGCLPNVLRFQLCRRRSGQIWAIAMSRVSMEFGTRRRLHEAGLFEGSPRPRRWMIDRPPTSRAATTRAPSNPSAFARSGCGITAVRSLPCRSRLLGAVQNQSRDWVIDKLTIGITYDSDIERARKLIKQIGLELA